MKSKVFSTCCWKSVSRIINKITFTVSVSAHSVQGDSQLFFNNFSLSLFSCNE